jgi:hypothetical protein
MYMFIRYNRGYLLSFSVNIIICNITSNGFDTLFIRPLQVAICKPLQVIITFTKDDRQTSNVSYRNRFEDSQVNLVYNI